MPSELTLAEKRRLRWLALGAGLVALAARLPTVTHLPPTWDTVQYVLGILHYNVPMHEPHPPGYFLFVFTAKLLHLLGLAPYTALVVMSLVAGAAMVGLLAWWAGKLAGEKAALATAALAITSPLAWGYAIQGDTYAVSGLASALVGYLCWRVYSDRRAAVWPAALVLGIAGGMRPTDALFLFPLFLWCVVRRGGAQTALGLAMAALVTVAWVGPMVQLSGGWETYRQTSRALSTWVWSESPLANPPVSYGLHLGGFLLCAVAALFMGWVFVPYGRGTELTRRPWFLLLWVAPAAVFYLAVHLATPGYFLLLAPAMLLPAGMGLGRLLRQTGGGPGLVLVALVVALNVGFTWSTVVAGHRAAEQGRREIQRVCAPYASGLTVMLVTQEFPRTEELQQRWVPYREAMYLCPEARVVMYPMEQTALRGGPPNYGIGLRSYRLKPPLELANMRYLLLMDDRLLPYLPQGVAARQILESQEARVYVVALDPREPLILGEKGKLTVHPLAGAKGK